MALLLVTSKGLFWQQESMFTQKKCMLKRHLQYNIASQPTNVTFWLKKLKIVHLFLWQGVHDALDSKKVSGPFEKQISTILSSGDEIHTLLFASYHNAPAQFLSHSTKNMVPGKFPIVSSELSTFRFVMADKKNKLFQSLVLNNHYAEA